MSQNALHSNSAATTLWSTANVSEAIPGLVTPLTWSLWISAQPFWNQGFYDMGILSDEELATEPTPDTSNMAVFYGRAVMNVNLLRRMGDRMPDGSANATEEAIAGHVRPGLEDQPDEVFRARAAEKMPQLIASYPATMEALAIEADQQWRNRTNATGVPWRDHLEVGADIFRRAQQYQGLATMVVSGIYAQLAMLCAELGSAEAVNVLSSGHGNLDENRMLAALWATGRGEQTLDEFISDFGFHGPNEGIVEAESWRENPGLLELILARYRDADASAHPEAITAGLAAARDRTHAELREAAGERAPELDGLVSECARLMPYRELGKATFLRGIDLVRMAIREAGKELAAAHQIQDAADVRHLTIHELLDQEFTPTRDLIDARRAERDSYVDLALPDVFEGQPEAIRPVDAASAAGDSTVVAGMGVSPGVVEGRAMVLDSPDQDVAPGDIVVAALTDPSWAPIFLIAAGMVVDVGGALSHAAIVARELGLPTVIGTGDGTRQINTGDRIRIDGAAGTVDILERA